MSQHVSWTRQLLIRFDISLILVHLNKPIYFFIFDDIQRKTTNSDFAN
jgi:hypothetical protein